MTATDAQQVLLPQNVTQPEDAAAATSLDDTPEAAGVSERFQPRPEVFDKIDGRLTQIEQQLRRLKTDDAVLTQMHEQHRQLAEDFHGREVLGPVLLTLIGIADRCRQQIRQAQLRLDKREALHVTTINALRYLRDARTADLTELENLLAIHGVQRFEHPGPEFSARHQHCLRRVPSQDADLHGRIAQRLAPGYQRGQTVIRPESVAVYVFDAPSPLSTPAPVRQNPPPLAQGASS